MPPRKKPNQPAVSADDWRATEKGGLALVDTHCHIHSVDYPIPLEEVDAHNAENSVEFLVAVGTDADDSQRAVEFASGRPNTWAVVGQHPHEAKFGVEPLERLRALLSVNQDDDLVLGGAQKEGSLACSLSEHVGGSLGDRTQDNSLRNKASRASSLKATFPGARIAARQGALPSGPLAPEGEAYSTASARKIVGIGECGLDYFYGHSSKQDQEKVLRYQMELALEHDLPLVFHVREAFDDFWPIFDSYQGIRGELHSYTDDSTNMAKALERGLYIGVNGIMTFTKNAWQLEVARSIPLDKLLLETDAPFLTPKPLRGKVNEPAHVLLVAKFISDLRGMSLEDVAQTTTTNARQLFSI